MGRQAPTDGRRAPSDAQLASDRRKTSPSPSSWASSTTAEPDATPQRWLSKSIVCRVMASAPCIALCHGTSNWALCNIAASWTTHDGGSSSGGSGDSGSSGGGTCPFTPDDFEAFIAERQRTLQDAIENLMIKDRLDLPPQLRELDARMGACELGLRRVVDANDYG